MVLTAVLLALFINVKLGLSKDQMEGKSIIIEQSDDTPSGTPRAPAFNPCSAHLLSQGVVLESSTPCGLVNVTLISSAGDFFTTDFDTSEGAVLIPVSGNAGSYTLLLTMPSGAQYVGRFEI